MPRITVGITGASGQLYARRLLRALAVCRGHDGVDLVVSQQARVALDEELDVGREGPLDLAALVGGEAGHIRLHDNGDVAAPIASGSQRSLGMVIVPCSMATVARVAGGVSDSLLTRAADVCLKESRRLILVARESPLSIVHLRNLLAAAEAGATILPASPPLYHRPKTVDDMVDQILARVLDHLGLDHELGRRWRSVDV